MYFPKKAKGLLQHGEEMILSVFPVESGAGSRPPLSNFAKICLPQIRMVEWWNEILSSDIQDHCHISAGHA